MTILDFQVRTAQLSPESYVVSIVGELDLHTAPELEQAFGAILSRGGRSVVVDLAGLEFIDSAALAALLRAEPRFQSRGGRFILVTEDRRTLRTLEITGLDLRFDIEPRLGNAVEQVLSATLASATTDGSAGRLAPDGLAPPLPAAGGPTAPGGSLSQ